jgi:hypothetical protein
VVNQLEFALNSTISDLTDLLTVETLPLLAIQFLEELENEDGVNEVNEGVTHITLVLEVNRQVEEVILVFMVLVNLLQQHFLCVLVRDVLDHDGGSIVFQIQNVIQLQFEFLTIMP